MDKSDYSRVLTKLTTNSSVQHLAPKSRGQVVECILGLGFVAQLKGCKKLEGIMDLVVFLENKVLFKDEHENMEEEEQEERPLTITDFSTAVGEIHKKLDKLIQ
eukprot:744298-Heterocapsa_arctica.AAC.1